MIALGGTLTLNFALRTALRTPHIALRTSPHAF